MPAVNGNTRRYLTPEEAAEEYGFSSAEHIRRLARGPDGPPSLKIGHLVRFDRADLDAWMESHRR